MKMKKLVVVTTIALAAMLGQASQIDWKFSTNVSGQKGYNVYLVASIPTGGFTQDGDNSISKNMLGTAGNTGTIGGSRSPYSANGTVDGLTATDGSTVNFYYVIVDPNDSTGYWTVASSAEAYTTATTHTDSTIGASAGASALSAAKTAWATGGGASGDGPEPTSGLLLLVGAGILGLRRKRA